MKNSLITVIGPTAIGKTALAISLAKHFQTEVISSDSRQFYKEMTIGTAVPSREEQQEVPHHFIQHISIETAYSVGRFESDAMERLNSLFKKYNELILVGGSALYTRAVLQGLDEFPEIKSGIREQLNRDFKKGGIPLLQDQLQALDPAYYKQVDLNNPHRLIRALEVCISSGTPYSRFLNRPKRPRPFVSLLVGLKAERAVLYKHINKRVDLMMENGLLNEVKQLYPFKDYNALQTVGYQELFTYLEGRCSLDEAVAEIKKNTRRFAKRQLTWYRKMENVLWFDHQTPHEEIALKVHSKIKISA
ncbi:MAG: tRNA (adenosine(37)-N6)-dimethylallyltransferase MiaA [Eudoraea sp.]|nr:tRNA (adenosine(37)-N6)-dimethylallyltransferase MiaA [Eudoraea sp.]